MCVFLFEVVEASHDEKLLRTFVELSDSTIWVLYGTQMPDATQSEKSVTCVCVKHCVLGPHFLEVQSEMPAYHDVRDRTYDRP